MTTAEWLAARIELLTLNYNAGFGRFCPHYPQPLMLTSLRKPRDASCEACAGIHLPPEFGPHCDRCDQRQISLEQDMVWDIVVLPMAPAPGAVEWRVLVSVCLGCAGLESIEQAA